MKKTTMLAFAFMVGLLIGISAMSMNGFLGKNEVFSNSDEVCKVVPKDTSTACECGDWSAWDLDTHKQTCDGFIRHVHTEVTWYQRPHKECGYRKEETARVVTMEPCHMERSDNEDPNISATTENIANTCKDCNKK